MSNNGRCHKTKIRYHKQNLCLRHADIDSGKEFRLVSVHQGLTKSQVASHAALTEILGVPDILIQTKNTQLPNNRPSTPTNREDIVSSTETMERYNLSIIWTYRSRDSLPKSDTWDIPERNAVDGPEKISDRKERWSQFHLSCSELMDKVLNFHSSFVPVHSVPATGTRQTVSVWGNLH